MGRTSENRIRKLERAAPPPPCREVDFGWRSEEEYAELIALGKRALAGDAAAEALFNQLVDRPPLPPPRIWPSLLRIADHESKIG